MLIHFDADATQCCDNCGRRGTLMHLTFVSTRPSFDLCGICFRALAEALRQATRKLGHEDHSSS
jgi:ribosomal protein S14